MTIPRMMAPGICAGLRWMRPNNMLDAMIAYQGLMFHFSIFRIINPRKRYSSAIGAMMQSVRIPIGLCARLTKSWLVGLSACYFYVKISPPSKKLSFVCHAQSAFKSSLNHNSPERRFLPLFWSSLMTGACRLLRPR